MIGSYERLTDGTLQSLWFPTNACTSAVLHLSLSLSVYPCLDVSSRPPFSLLFALHWKEKGVKLRNLLQGSTISPQFCGLVSLQGFKKGRAAVANTLEFRTFLKLRDFIFFLVKEGPLRKVYRESDSRKIAKNRDFFLRSCGAWQVRNDPKSRFWCHTCLIRRQNRDLGLKNRDFGEIRIQKSRIRNR